VLPLQFQPGESAQTLELTGEETYSIVGLRGNDVAPSTVTVRVDNGRKTQQFVADVRIDTPAEAEYYRHGGILPYVLRQLLAS
jgi:aconitate hydratase